MGTQQCDPLWGSDIMGIKGHGEQNTICNEGCAMSSMSMALAGLNITLPPSNISITPGAMNTYLQAAQLYQCYDGDCNDLEVVAPESFTPYIQLDPSNVLPPIDDIAAGIEAGTKIFIAHVRSVRP